MQASLTEYKRYKRESQAWKIPWKVLTHWSNKIQSEIASNLKCPGNSGHHEKIKTKNHRNRGEGRF